MFNSTICDSLSQSITRNISRMSNSVAAAGQDQADGRTTRWDSHKAERRNLVLEAAVDAINEFGPDIGVNEIATRADLPRSVVYRIFKDRSDLDEQVRARIIELLMTSLAPALAPQGPIGESIDNAISTYVGWIVDYPKLHQFLGKGSSKHRTTGSRVVTGTRTAIAVQLTGMLRSALDKQSKTTELAEPLAFGLVGLVDGSVNRWLNNPKSKVSADELSEFLSVSAWQVLEANFRRLGVAVDPTTAIADLV